MLFSTPRLDDAARDLAELDDLRARLVRETHRPAPWMGTLRRLVKATTIAQSTGIEGFHVSDDDALSLVTGAARAGAGETARQAVECYARAMNHVAVMARDPSFRWLDRVILDLHYDACSFQRDQDPGMWRTTPVGVVDGRGRIVYQAPPAGEVPELMREVVEWLEQGDLDAHVVVRAAMAHLHVVSVHPFRDGNGRVSRIVQSLVLARDGLLTPELASIEEYLGEHTPAYYEQLQRAHGNTYDPRRDVGEWVGFCIRAHLDQARRRLAQMHQAATRWEQLEQLADERRWPDRFVIGLEQALFDACDRTSYAREADVSAGTASSDLRRMVEGGMLA
jgi:Fic family protein